MQQLVTSSMSLLFFTIFHQLIFYSLVLKLIVNFMLVNEFNGDKVVIHIKQQPNTSIRHNIWIPIEHHNSNLLIIANIACIKK